MRGENRVRLSMLIGACAGLLLGACSTMPTDAALVGGEGPYEAQAPAQPPPPPLAAAPVTSPTAGSPMVREPPATTTASISYPRYGDSDDYLCNFAPAGDPRSPQACIRLRGPDAYPQPPARFGDTDDFVCNHGTPGAPHTTQACLRLRPPEQ
jgi:hypothetical protein